jgi:methylenetetrahydromethanopterin dehydrogenase
MVVKIGVIKCGNLGTSPVIDLVLDERADRPNIDVRGVGSGAKMNPEQIEEAVPKIMDFDPDFVVFISPNPGAPGPARARELLSEMDVPAVIVGDAPGMGKKDEMDEQGLGYIIVLGDPMIGARREFLDPTEMASFNSDVIKVLSATGAYRVVQQTLDGIIATCEAGNEIDLPKVAITADKAVEAGGFSSP